MTVAALPSKTTTTTSWTCCAWRTSFFSPQKIYSFGLRSDTTCVFDSAWVNFRLKEMRCYCDWSLGLALSVLLINVLLLNGAQVGLRLWLFIGHIRVSFLLSCFYRPDPDTHLLNQLLSTADIQLLGLRVGKLPLQSRPLLSVKMRITRTKKMNFGSQREVISR